MKRLRFGVPLKPYSHFDIMIKTYLFEDIIAEIEKGLCENTDISRLAGMAGMSVYEFRRVFTFVAGIPLGEYIRKRRLSVAAAELAAGGISVTNAAIKYGYDNPSSFSRAFKAYHGISPAELCENGGDIKLLSRISVDITLAGGNDVSYNIIRDSAFDVCGIKGISSISDTECCEEVWEIYNRSPYALATPTDGHIYAVYGNAQSSVNCCIGFRGNIPADAKVHIHESVWICFKMNTIDDGAVNKFYKDILMQLFSEGMYQRDNTLPNIEVYPADMENEGFEWEIRIPVKAVKNDR